MQEPSAVGRCRPGDCDETTESIRELPTGPISREHNSRTRMFLSEAVTTVRPTFPLGSPDDLRMTTRHIDVFFYGLFMDADALRAKGLHPVDPRAACVRGFALHVGQRATLVPNDKG